MEHFSERTIPGLEKHRRFARNPAGIKSQRQNIVVGNLSHINLATVRFHVPMAIGNQMEFIPYHRALMMRSLAKPSCRRKFTGHHDLTIVGENVSTTLRQ